MNRSRVIVVPVLNVDGFNKSRTDGELIDLRAADNGGTASILGTPGSAYMRKNCRLVDGQDTPDGTCALAATSPGGYGAGVDLNRNYGGFWGGPGASDVFADPTYRGAAAFSEPETQNIRELISGRQVTTLITNHTFSNLVLRPNGAAPDLVPSSQGIPLGDPFDEAALKALGDEMAAQNGYTSQHAWELYDTTGSVEDWSYNATGGFGYTFEIGPDEFHPPFPKVVDEYLGAGQYAGKGNREAYLIALENAVDPTTHSVLTGKAPAGATLRLRKTFATPTWDGSIQDSLDTTMTVGSERPVHLARQPLHPPGGDGPADRDGVRGPGAGAVLDRDHGAAAVHRPGVHRRPGRRPARDQSRLADSGRPRPRGLPEERRRLAHPGRQLRERRRGEGAGAAPGSRRRARTSCG